MLRGLGDGTITYSIKRATLGLILWIGSSVALSCVRLQPVRVDQRVSWNLRLMPKSCIVEG